MKKLYILLFLFIATFANAQQSLNDYTVCDVNNDNMGEFNLLTKNAEMLFVLNAAEYTFAYYESLADAQAGTFAISNVENYTNVWSPQLIFASAINVQTQEAFYFQCTLIVSPPLVVNAASLTYCDPTELPFYNLNDAIPQMIGNQQNLTITFFDAINGNVIAEPSSYTPSITPVQVLAVSISDQCTTEQTTITLNTNNCNPTPCLGPTQFNVNTATLTSTSAQLTWMASNTNVFSLYVAPAGVPVPTPQTPATYIVQSSNIPRTYTLTGLIPDTCYVFYVKSNCNPGSPAPSFSEWIGPFNFCTRNCENNGECADNLNLIAFIDANYNGTKDIGEIDFNQGRFAYDLNNSGSPYYGHNNNGNFIIIDSNPANLYDLSFAVNAELTPYYGSTATFNDVNIPAGGGSHTYNFPITSIQSYNDIEVELIPSGQPRPGFTHTNIIRYKNKGTSTIASGTVNFVKDSNVTIASVSPSIGVNTSNGYSFNFTNLTPNEQRSVQIVLQVPTIPTVNLGQMLTNSVAITPLVDEAFPENNNAYLSQTIVGSYDPNDKTEAHGGKIGLDYFSDNDYLTYTIQFENTGSTSAEFIRVEDLLDAGLDADSVVMLNASHPYNMRRIDKNLIWNFYNVNLPTTTANPAQSHGFIQFKVKPTSGYAVGTMIPNAANIYFDYNPAIVTNTFQTEFLAPLSTSSFAADGFYMYPNPTKTFIYLGLKDTAESITNIAIRDVLGKSVKVINAESNETSVDVSAFSKGIYFVEITTKNHLKMIKKLVVN